MRTNARTVYGADSRTHNIGRVLFIGRGGEGKKQLNLVKLNKFSNADTVCDDIMTRRILILLEMHFLESYSTGTMLLCTRKL